MHFEHRKVTGFEINYRFIIGARHINVRTNKTQLVQFVQGTIHIQEERGLAIKHNWLKIMKHMLSVVFSLQYIIVLSKIMLTLKTDTFYYLHSMYE